MFIMNFTYVFKLKHLSIIFIYYLYKINNSKILKFKINIKIYNYSAF